MSSEQTRAVAEAFLQRLGGGAPPEQIGELFAEDLDWNIPGSAAALPWLGRKRGRGAVVDFVEQTARMIEREVFEIDDIVANDDRAVILGRLASRLKRTGKRMETEFAVILTVSNGRIVRFLMLEDSLAVAEASRA